MSNDAGDALEALGRAAAAASEDAAGDGLRGAGLVGRSLGLIAAGAAAGIALERITVGRVIRRRAGAELGAAAIPFGSLRGVSRTVTADDGTRLYVELDGVGWGAPDGRADPSRARGQDRAERALRLGRLPRRRSGDPESDAAAARRRGRVPLPAPPTVIFCHGYCLNQDCWHFQRAALRDGLRLVFWDQRSHGRSERGRAYQGGRPATIDQLGGDLRTVIDAVAPEGPLVLVGHSMGGMTIMALAELYPALFRDRVAGVALLGTSAGNWNGVTLGLPGYGAKVLHRVAPGVLRVLGRQVELVERTRRAGSELAGVLYRRYSFGSGTVNPAVARFAEQMLDATPIDVIAEFYPAIDAHEKSAALTALDDIPTLVLTGTRDLLTPPSHSQAIADAVPQAELVLVPDAGHLVMLEHPELVDSHLAALVKRAADRAGVPLPNSVRALAARTAGDATVHSTDEVSPDEVAAAEARAAEVGGVLDGGPMPADADLPGLDVQRVARRPR